MLVIHNDKIPKMHFGLFKSRYTFLSFCSRFVGWWTRCWYCSRYAALHHAAAHKDCRTAWVSGEVDQSVYTSYEARYSIAILLIAWYVVQHSPSDDEQGSFLQHCTGHIPLRFRGKYVSIRNWCSLHPKTRSHRGFCLIILAGATIRTRNFLKSVNPRVSTVVVSDTYSAAMTYLQ